MKRVGAVAFHCPQPVPTDTNDAQSVSASPHRDHIGALHVLKNTGNLDIVGLAPCQMLSGADRCTASGQYDV